MNEAKTYDQVSGAALLIGFYEGVVPFGAKAFDWTPVLCLPRHLPSPLWWIVSSLVTVGAFLTVWGVDSAKKRRFPDA